MSLSSVLVHGDSNQAIYLAHFSYALISGHAKSPQQPEKMRSALKISLGPFVQGPKETRMRQMKSAAFGQVSIVPQQYLKGENGSYAIHLAPFISSPPPPSDKID